MNRAELIGRLGKDPEIKTVNSGDTVCRLSVATSEKWTDKDGQKQEKTQWHNVVVWGKLAEVCGKYLKKGSQVFLAGKLETRSWEDPQGVKKYTTEIIAKELEMLGGQEKREASSYHSGHELEPPFGSSEEFPF